MPRIGRQVRVGIAGALCVLISAFPVYAAATTPTATMQDASAPDVLITEFQTNGGTAAQEFIELYNATDQDITFGDATTLPGPVQWKLQFFNSTAAKTGVPAWTTAPSATNSIPLTGTVSAHDYFLIASTNYLPGGMTPDLIYAPSSSHLMTDTGGALQLLSIDTTTAVTTAHDRVIWLAQTGSTVLPAGVLASPSSGKSLQRIPNDDTEYVNEDGSITDFGPEDTITPLDAWLPPIIVETSAETTTDDDTTTDDATTPGDTVVAAPISNDGLDTPQITELLPNPATPLTDADDEFIELYNSNSAAFNLEGYKLEVGTTTFHAYTLPAGTVIAPLSYQAFYSSVTGLSLSNSGGQARLREPAGKVLNETTAYGTAADNQAWILNDATWQWTTSATPGLANILAAPVVAAKATKTTTPKVAATKKAAATAKPKTTKATTKKAAAKKTTAKKKVTTAKTAASVTPEKPKAPIHPGILVAVGVAAVLYGLYEYRHDIAHKFRQLGRNRKSGVVNRLAPAGR